MFVTPLYTLDIKQAVGIQIWMKITWAMVLQNIDLNVALSLVVYFITLIWFTISVFKDEEEDENKVCIGNMLINKEAGKVYIGGSELKLRKGVYHLLLMFVEKKGHTLTRKEICQYFWPRQDNTKNNLHNLISSVRKSLQNYPEYQLITNEDESWSLIVSNSEIQHKEKQFF